MMRERVRRRRAPAVRLGERLRAHAVRPLARPRAGGVRRGARPVAAGGDHVRDTQQRVRDAHGGRDRRRRTGLPRRPARRRRRPDRSTCASCRTAAACAPWSAAASSSTSTRAWPQRGPIPGEKVGNWATENLAAGTFTILHFDLLTKYCLLAGSSCSMTTRHSHWRGVVELLRADERERRRLGSPTRRLSSPSVCVEGRQPRCCPGARVGEGRRTSTCG